LHAKHSKHHAVNAAKAADVAAQAATVAQQVASHTEQVAKDTAKALRYTQDALKRAGANADDIAEVGRQADKLDKDAGVSDRKKAKKKKHEDEDEEGEQENKEAEKKTKKKDQQGEANSEEATSSESKKSSNLNTDEKSAPSKEGDDDDDKSAAADASSESEKNLDVNSQIVPYPSAVEPFGQEAPAKELSKNSIKQSDGMVDKIENAQGTESKRAVYRALTKLRGATVASYDGIAKGHLSNVDNYNAKHKWRDLHPMRHLAEEESDTHIWAFPKASKRKSKPAKKRKPAKKKGEGPAAETAD